MCWRDIETELQQATKLDMLNMQIFLQGLFRFVSLIFFFFVPVIGNNIKIKVLINYNSGNQQQQQQK